MSAIERVWWATVVVYVAFLALVWWRSTRLR